VHWRPDELSEVSDAEETRDQWERLKVHRVGLLISYLLRTKLERIPEDFRTPGIDIGGGDFSMMSKNMRIDLKKICRFTIGIAYSYAENPTDRTLESTSDRGEP
jgi:hypothetical protein